MVEVNTSDLEAKLKKAKDNIKRNVKPALNNSMIKAVQAVSKFVPPQKNKDWIKVIPLQMYKRPIFNILTFLKTKKKLRPASLRNILRQRFNRGDKYFAKKDSYIKPMLFFGKNKREMERKYKRIKYRGLVKMMFGLQLIKNGTKSGFFERMLNKSKDIAKLSNLNELSYNETHDTYRLENTNKAIPSENLIGITKHKTQIQLYQRLKYYVNKMIKESYK